MYMVYTDWVLNSTQSVCIYTPPRDREHTPEAAAAFRTVRSECFELPGLGLATLRLLTIPLPIRVVEEKQRFIQRFYLSQLLALRLQHAAEDHF